MHCHVRRLVCGEWGYGHCLPPFSCMHWLPQLARTSLANMTRPSGSTIAANYADTTLQHLLPVSVMPTLPYFTNASAAKHWHGGHGFSAANKNKGALGHSGPFLRGVAKSKYVPNVLAMLIFINIFPLSNATSVCKSRRSISYILPSYSPHWNKSQNAYSQHRGHSRFYHKSDASLKISPKCQDSMDERLFIRRVIVRTPDKADNYLPSCPPPVAHHKQ